MAKTGQCRPPGTLRTPRPSPALAAPHPLPPHPPATRATAAASSSQGARVTISDQDMQVVAGPTAPPAPAPPPDPPRVEGVAGVPTLEVQPAQAVVSSATRPLFPSPSPAQLLEMLTGSNAEMPEFLRGLEVMRTSSGRADGPLIYKPSVPRASAAADPASLPLMLYLPGIDGTGLAAYRQFEGLAAIFDLHALYLPPADRSSFQQITTAVQVQLEALLEGGDPLRPVYLLGESFGGLVALGVAAACQAVDRVVLVNPATSFNDSVWPSLGPLLTALEGSSLREGRSRVSGWVAGCGSTGSLGANGQGAVQSHASHTTPHHTTPHHTTPGLWSLMGSAVSCIPAASHPARTPAACCVQATSFNDSVWPSLGPLLTALPSQLYNALPILLSPVLTNPANMILGSLGGSGLTSFPPPPPAQVVQSLGDAAWRAVDLLPQLGSLRAVLPAATLTHRLLLLREGSRAVNGMLAKVPQRVLLVMGERDLLIPSSTEGPRLRRSLPRARLRLLLDRSHALLQEVGMDLAALLQEEGFYSPRRQLSTPPAALRQGGRQGRHSQAGPKAVPLGGAMFGRPLPVELPSAQELQQAQEQGGVTLLARLVSPVFFSTPPTPPPPPAAADPAPPPAAAPPPALLPVAASPHPHPPLTPLATAPLLALQGHPPLTAAATQQQLAAQSVTTELTPVTPGPIAVPDKGQQQEQQYQQQQGQQGDQQQQQQQGGVARQGGGEEGAAGKAVELSSPSPNGLPATPTPTPTPPPSPSPLSSGPRIRQGLGAVPLGRPGRPVLLVGNHQLLASDMPLMVAQFLKERGSLVRGLAHPFIFQGLGVDGGRDEASGGSLPAGTRPAQQPNAPGAAAQPAEPSGGHSALWGGSGTGTGYSRGWAAGSRRQRGATAGTASFGSLLQTFGAVPVSGFALHALLDAGETVLLYPGGVREAYKNRNEKYQLFWPERPEFVRMAARFGATIVPFSAVGAEDGLNHVLDAKELLSLPFVGDALRRQQGRVPAARRGVSLSEVDDGGFVPPILSLNPPARYYFLFGEPIETSPSQANDKAAVAQLYKQTKSAVQSGIEYLLRQREQDPYADLLKRVAYEVSWGGKRQAPTFVP